ncbi:MAG: AAA family ATPase [Candidatus Schekmanbacteria bacterium]|nr:AAA family ATPase [Candidatus Schekmanbacteria bacterium]
MSTLVPQLIVDRDRQGQRSGVVTGAAVFADISGFTILTERLMAHGKEGAEELARTLRFYFTPLVGAVEAAGGMITGFAGDAFTAVFPGGETEGGAEAGAAVRAALAMQVFFAENSTYTTRYGEFAFSMKAGVAWGESRWHIVDATPDAASFFFAGPAIDGCAAAEHHCERGQVVVDEGIRARLAGGIAWEPVGENVFRVLEDPPSFLPPQAGRGKAGDGAAPELQDNGYSATQTRIGLTSGETRFLPADIASVPIEGEFRIVSSVFAAFTTPGDLPAFIAQAHRAALKLGGTFTRADFGDKGGNILVFFGAPTTHENDASRALDYALALCGELPAGAQLRAGVTHDVRYVGFNGGGNRLELACLGRATNLAARMMMKAPWGEVWCCPKVSEQAQRTHELRPAGAHPFKGFDAPLEVFRLERAQTRQIRVFRSARFVGREAELGQLSAHVEPVFAGRFAGLVYVDGEAGAGKSFLVDNFRRALAEGRGEKAFTWIDAPCDATLRASLNPFAWALRDQLKMATGKSASERRAAFDRLLDDLIVRLALKGRKIRAEVERLRSVLGALLDLRWEGSLYEQLDPRLRYENTLIAVRVWLEAMASVRPVIVHLEDAHLADEDTAEAIARIVKSARNTGASLALVCTCRFAAGGERFRFAIESECESETEGGEDADRGAGDGEAERGADAPAVELRGLSAEAVRALAEAQLGEPVAPSLAALVMERANGNPLFAEQIVVYLRDRELLSKTAEGWVATAGEDAVPDDVSTLLVARLDRLPAEVKRVAESAAVLGREFGAEVLAAMVGSRAEVSGALHVGTLERVWSETSPGRFLFSHVLLRDAAYDMQARARLRRLHGRAGQAFEEAYAEDLGSVLGELAHHFEKAEQRDKAVLYLGRAGDAARDAYRNADALGYYDRLAAWLPRSEAAWSDCAMKLGGVRELVGRWAEAEADYRAALTAALEAGERLRAARAGAALGNLLGARGDTEQGLEELERALFALPEDDGDVAPRIQALDYKAALLFRCGRVDEAERIWRGILRDRQAALTALIAADIISHLAVVEQTRGSFCEAKALYRTALARLERADDKRRTANILANMTGIHWALGEKRESAELGEQVSRLYREIGDRQRECTFAINMGVALINAERLEDANGLLVSALEAAQDIGDRRLEANALLRLGNLSFLGGELEEADAFAARSIAAAGALGERSLAAEATRLRAQVRQETRCFDEARNLFGQAVLAQSQLGERDQAAATLRMAGAMEVACGNLASALSLLDRSVSLQREVGSPQDEARTLYYSVRARRWQGRDPRDLAPDIDAAEALARDLGERADIALCLCERGHLLLMARQDPAHLLSEASRVLGTVGTPVDRSEVAAACLALAAAASAVEEGRELVRGEAADQLPEGLRIWLENRGS